MKKVAAMILAGGRGKRMDILCHGRPKPALPFAGRFRVIDFSLSNCVHSGIRNVSVLVDFQRHHLTSYVADWRLANIGEDSLQVLEPKAGSYEGTADAVYQNLDYLHKSNAEVVLVLAADHVYRMDYRKMLAFHEQSNADITIGVFRVPVEQAHRFGILSTEESGRITDFAEKPTVPQDNLASMGIYIFNKEYLVRRLADDHVQESSAYDFGYSLIPNMLRRDRVFAYQFDGFWQDIGTLQTYYESNMELTRDMPTLSLNGHWPVFTTDNSLGPPKVVNQENIKRSLISPGCTIRGIVDNCILSSGVRIDEHAIVRNSIIMGNTTIGRHSMVERCILDEGVKVGEFCYVGFGERLIADDWDITVLGKDAIVPAGTAIGRNCKILPDVLPSDFAGRVVPAGSVLLQR